MRNVPSKYARLVAHDSGWKDNLNLRRGLPVSGNLLVAVLFCFSASVGHYTAAEGVVGGDTAKLRNQLFDASGQLMIVAHRACWSDGFPENSLSAIRHCLDIGVEILELDVRLSKDGVPVLMHDAHLGRTTTGTGLVSDHTYEELLSLRLLAGDGSSQSVTKERIPALRDVLELVGGKALINLDVKGASSERILEYVTASGDAGMVIFKRRIGSESDVDIERYIASGAMFMPIIAECAPSESTKYCVDIELGLPALLTGADLVALEVVFQSPSFFLAIAQEAKERGLRIWLNSLSPRHSAGMTDAIALDNPDAVWGQMVCLGASIIQTDYPSQLRDYNASSGVGG